MHEFDMTFRDAVDLLEDDFGNERIQIGEESMTYDDLLAKLAGMIMAAERSLWDYCLPLCGGADAIGNACYMRGKDIDVALLIERPHRLRVDLEGQSYWIEGGLCTKVTPEQGARAEHDRLIDQFEDEIDD